MPIPAALPGQPLDAPLPSEIAGRGHGWLTRYRAYPVFSAPWVRGRLWVFGGLAALLMAMTVLPLLDRPLRDIPWGALAQSAVQLFVPIVAGPWLGWRVRRRALPPAREWRGLVAAMALLVATLLSFHEWGAEPLKQWLAERSGLVDEDGRRRRVVMSIGVFVHTPEDAASATPAEPRTAADHRSEQLVTVVNLTGLTLLSFWLGGGAALWGWRRETAGLATLARERELQLARAQRREAELQLSVLAAQVEPHFLFNTLAGVRSAIATDPPRASEMIDRLVDYLRAAIPRLRSDGAAQTTLGAQLDIVRAYLGLMAARMPRLSFVIDVREDLLAAPCPPLMLISLAENAVRHGVEPKVGPVQVRVSAERMADGRLAITVADDGAGFGAAGSGTGIGLSNIRQRLQQMYPGRAELTLTSRAEGGVCATLILPAE